VSYDLYYVAPADTRFDPSEAAHYLSALPHCTVNSLKDGGLQALYEHPDTGVYWSCAYGPPSTEYESPFDPEKPLPDGVVDTGLAFNLNFARPRYFGLEAMPFAAAIGRDLSLQVYDPQDDCQAADPDAAKLTASWTRNNEWASRDLPDAKHLDAGLSVEMWKYNAQVANVQAAFEALGTGEVVPTIRPVVKRGSSQVLRAVMWGAGFKVAFPPCDAVMTLSKPTFFERVFHRKEHVGKISLWGDVHRALAPSIEKQTICGLDYLVQTGASAEFFGRIFDSIPSERCESLNGCEMVRDSMFVDVDQASS
jgi:hypothetical protein